MKSVTPLLLLHLTSPLDLGQSGEDPRREAAASMLLFGLTQHNVTRNPSPERGTPRVLASLQTRHVGKLSSDGSSANPSVTGACGGKKVHLVEWNLLQEVWLHLAPQRARPASLVEVHENSFCTALWSKSVGAIEDCREFPSHAPHRRRQETSTHIEHRHAPSMQQEKQALTRQQQRRRCVNGCFVRYGGLEDDAMSHQVIFCVVSCAPVVFFRCRRRSRHVTSYLARSCLWWW